MNDPDQQPPRPTEPTGTGASEPEAAARRLAAQLADIRNAVARGAIEDLEATPESVYRNARALAGQLPRPLAWFDRLAARLLRPVEESIGNALAQPALLAGLRGGGAPGLRTFVLDRARLDVQIASGRDGGIAVLLQVDHDDDSDGALEGHCAVLDHASGATIASGTLDGSGAARLELTEVPSVAEIAVRWASGTFLSGPVRLR